jgi:hypothetical protein
LFTVTKEAGDQQVTTIDCICDSIHAKRLGMEKSARGGGSGQGACRLSAGGGKGKGKDRVDVDKVVKALAGTKGKKVAVTSSGRRTRKLRLPPGGGEASMVTTVSLNDPRLPKVGASVLTLSGKRNVLNNIAQDCGGMNSMQDATCECSET